MKESLRICSSLLRGELSAVDAYEQALLLFREGEGRSILEEIRQEHQTNCRTLTTWIRAAGEEPSSSAGLWGGFVTAAQATATVLGAKATLKLLKEGEEHGIKAYKDALNHSSLGEEIRQEIQSSIIPTQKEHIQMLDRLLEREYPAGAPGGLNP